MISFGAKLLEGTLYLFSGFSDLSDLLCYLGKSSWDHHFLAQDKALKESSPIDTSTIQLTNSLVYLLSY